MNFNATEVDEDSQLFRQIVHSLRKNGVWWTPVSPQTIDSLFTPMRSRLREAGAQPDELSEDSHYVLDLEAVNGQTYTGASRPSDDSLFRRETLVVEPADQNPEFLDPAVMAFVDVCRTLGRELMFELFTPYMEMLLERSQRGLTTPLTHGVIDRSQLTFMRYPHVGMGLHPHEDQSELTFGLQGGKIGLYAVRDDIVLPLPPNCFHIQTGENAEGWSDGTVRCGTHEVQPLEPNRESMSYLYGPDVWKLIGERYAEVCSNQNVQINPQPGIGVVAL
jgi:isopenicillin N synthase-like dioxygenase